MNLYSMGILVNYLIKCVVFILGISAGDLYSGKEIDISQSDRSLAVTGHLSPG